MLYILHGANDLQREEVLAAIVDAVGLTPDLRDLNTEVLHAPVSESDLRRACSTIPFLGDVRIIIARDVLGQTKGQAAKDIAAYLPEMPPTTTLVFSESKNISAKHPVLTQAKKMQADIQQFGAPKAKELPRWIRQRTQKLGGNIGPRAAAMLSQNIGGNLRLLDQEIRKLLLYCGENKTVTVDDVKAMVPYVQSADVIFNLVDAIGQRNARTAAFYLHRLLDVGEHPLGIFGMVVRQFRLLIQVRWMMDHGSNEQEIIARLKLHPFVAQKVRGQARQFTPNQLRTAYQMLSDSDLAIKRGLLEGDVALDLLVAQLTSL
jgi:DNA polymerase-3 subunit delta